MYEIGWGFWWWCEVGPKMCAALGEQDENEFVGGAFEGRWLCRTKMCMFVMVWDD